MSITYLARKGSQLTDEDARVIGERLHAIAGDDPLRPEDIVDDARMPTSPLHHYFDWDNEDASEKWRIWQARNYIRAIHIERKESPQPPMPAYVNITVKRDDGVSMRGYVETERAVKVEDWWQQVLEHERGRLISCQQNLRRYRELESIANGAVQMAIEALDAIKEPATMAVPALVEASA